MDGEIRASNAGEGQHAVIQKWLAVFFSMREEQWHVPALTEMGVHTSASNYRVPDFCMMRDDWRLEAITTMDPLLCVEILSRDDRMTEMHEKVDDYLHMGGGGGLGHRPLPAKDVLHGCRGTLIAVAKELMVEGTEIRLAVGRYLSS